MWQDKRYHSLDYELKKRYGKKVYKLALDGGFTCPNRDGCIGYGGCIFCSVGGSGDFAASRKLPISQQLEQAKKIIADKHIGDTFIAYFQAYTGTYAPIDTLRQIYMEAIQSPQVAILSIATRPDCLSCEVLDLLSELNAIKPVWIELGLQTIHEETAAYIRRGYELEVFETAIQALHERHIETIVHVILGLPNETQYQMLETARYLSHIPIDGIKFQLLHILKDTDLYLDYLKNPFHVLSLEEYTDILIDCIEILPPEVVIHRITGDGPKELLVAPQWSRYKKYVLNTINHAFKQRDTWQGKFFV